MRLMKIDTLPDGTRRQQPVKGMPVLPTNAQALVDTLNSMARRPTDSRYVVVPSLQQVAA